MSTPPARDRASGRPAPAAPPLWRQVAGAVLRERRRAAGLRLRDVAQRAGISVQYLSEVERGRKEPSSEMVESICGALGLGLLDLVRGVGRQLVLHGGDGVAPLVGARDAGVEPAGLPRVVGPARGTAEAQVRRPATDVPALPVTALVRMGPPLLPPVGPGRPIAVGHAGRVTVRMAA